MVRVSTGVLIVGVGLLLVPVPPIATALGILLILLGIGRRLFANV
ncbi:transporter [Natrinema sp. H-ect4]